MSTYRKNRKDLLFELVRTKFKLKYNDSVLGFVWVLLKPFIEFVILFFVWSSLGRGGDDPQFASKLMIGILAFSLFRESIKSGMGSVLSMSGIILKINMPQQYAVSSSILMSLVNFLINVVVILIMSLFTRLDYNFIGLPYFIAIILLCTVGTYAVSLYLSIFLIRLRDLDNIMDILLQVLFWGSAIFYPYNAIQGRFGTLIRLNPVATMIDAAREAIVNGRIVHFEVFLLLSVISVVLLYTGTKYFDKYIKYAAEYI